MPRDEPTSLRCAAFVDGQNLFRAAKEAFGYTFPNYDPQGLAKSIAASRGWQLVAAHFYTGIPDHSDDPFWHGFWTAKLGVLGTRGVVTFSRALRYRNETVKLPDGTKTVALVRREKGIDVRIALDVVRLARVNAFDVALLFSQDQDLSEVAVEVRRISRHEERWIKIASAFPSSDRSRNLRGINGTDWIPIDRSLYDACIDTNDYRPKAES